MKILKYPVITKIACFSRERIYSFESSNFTLSNQESPLQAVLSEDNEGEKKRRKQI